MCCDAPVQFGDNRENIVMLQVLSRQCGEDGAGIIHLRGSYHFNHCDILLGCIAHYRDVTMIQHITKSHLRLTSSLSCFSFDSRHCQKS